jgi:5-methyltetrahydrofolate--homocysteine methyltransferase
MAIDFSFDRWGRTKQTYARWWAGQLDRPIIRIRLTGRDPGRAEPHLPRRKRTAQYGFAVPPDQIVDRWDYDLSCLEYLGDAFPTCWPDFGAGAVAAFLGAGTHVDENTVWFQAPSDRDIRDIRFVFNVEHPWVQRIEEIVRSAHRRWGGLVQVAMTDLGGNLDILSTFRPGERLLLDLYDHPGEVERLLWEAHECWWGYYDHFNAVLQPTNPGYSAWAGIYCPAPSYMLQCDFAYMIGPEMFDRFVKPELVVTCRRLDHSFYHLDGVGQLPHLDSLLEIPELDGVQWIPGHGQRPCGDWPEVYEKIHRAGKLIQFVGPLEELEPIVDRLGTGRGILAGQAFPLSQRERAERFLETYGAA